MRMPIRLPDPTAAGADFVAVGECSLDYVGVVDDWPEPGAKQALRHLTLSPGGQAATAALACQRLGWPSRYVGCVGDDWTGERALAPLRHAGVDVRVLAKNGLSTRQALVLVESRGSDRTVLEHRDERLRCDLTELGNDVTDGRILLVDATDVAAATRAADRAKRRGQPVLIDVDGPRPGVRDLLRLVDVLIVPDSAIERLVGTGEVGRGLARLAEDSGSAIVVATLGDEGSVALSEGQELRTAAPVVDVLDTTGAGDAFRGGFAAGWLRLGPGAELDDVLRYANVVAALSCRALGAQGGLPSHDEVGRHL